MSADLEWLAAFNEKQRVTLMLVKAYLEDRGQRCLTYRGLRAYWQRNRLWRVIEWHTVERRLRELAEMRVLERRERGRRRRVVFCMPDNVYVKTPRLRVH